MMEKKRSKFERQESDIRRMYDAHFKDFYFRSESEIHEKKYPVVRVLAYKMIDGLKYYAVLDSTHIGYSLPGGNVLDYHSQNRPNSLLYEQGLVNSFKSFSVFQKSLLLTAKDELRQGCPVSLLSEEFKFIGSTIHFFKRSYSSSNIIYRNPITFVFEAEVEEGEYAADADIYTQDKYYKTVWQTKEQLVKNCENSKCSEQLELFIKNHPDF